jgi:hypothetical protein
MLSIKQDKNLAIFIRFISNYLLTSSHEKRAVGLHLLTELILYVPPELFPLILGSSGGTCLYK